MRVPYLVWVIGTTVLLLLVVGGLLWGIFVISDSAIPGLSDSATVKEMAE